MEIKHFSDIDITGKGIILGIGKFDGVHMGHRKILNEIVKKSKNKRLIPAVFSFKHFPVEFYLTTWEEKLSFFQSFNIELCIWCDYEEISFWQPFEFIEYLKSINVECIIVGKNFRFGAHQKGKIEDLQKDFDIIIIEPICISGEIVSSSKIREYLKSGEIEKANKLLGRNISFRGKVITGNSRGRELGFPTANLYLLNELKIKEGVYACWVKFKENFYKGALSIGNCPTFDNKEVKFEVHIIGINEILYGEILEIFPVTKIREQKKFKNINDLINRIKKDIEEINEKLIFPY